MKSYARLAFVLVLASAVAWPGAAAGDDCASNCGRAFEPTPLTTEAQYGVSAPITEQVTTPNGQQIYLESYKPTSNGGADPPDRVPTILQMHPYYMLYQATGQLSAAYTWRDFFVPRGYAFSIAHAPGTGNSTGCLELGGTDERHAAAHVIHHLGTRAPWSNGRVGMRGGSYDGWITLGVATLAGSADVSPVEGKTYAELVSPLKAIVASAAPTGAFETFVGDLEGVTVNPGAGTASVAAYLALTGDPPGHDVSCFPAAFSAVAAAEASGDYSPFFAERDLRKDAASVRAATLLYQGFSDTTVVPKTVVGFFDRLPAATPHKLLLGQWGHLAVGVATGNTPHELDSSHAWFDRHLMLLPTGTEEWPQVQVQDSTNQWRAEPSWPQVDGVAGQLALDESGLGAGTPSGDTPYQETSTTDSGAVFTAQLQKDLRIAGVAVLDLWVRLQSPPPDRDAHIAAVLRILGADGSPLAPPLYGARSARHLEAMPGDYFTQQTPVVPDTDLVRVPIRLKPGDLVAPAGSTIEIKIGGVFAPGPDLNPPAGAPSGSTGTVTILHDCAQHPSALRFLMPSRNPDWLNVRESASEVLTSTPSPTVYVDGGLAERPVCGRAPIDPVVVTRGSGPTAALLAGFSGAVSQQGVMLRWRTAQETEIAGFHLFRGKTKLNGTLIAAKQSGRSAGASYRFLDRPAPGTRQDVYRLEAVKLDGSRVRLASAEVKADAR